MLNMRNYARKESQTRQTALSRDGGTTWVEQKFDTQLPEPRCQGALLAVENRGEKLLLFTNPADGKSRVNMTLSVSRDQGINWNQKIPIYQSYAAYSDLVELDNGDVFILFEAGLESAYESINYHVVSKNAL